MATVNHYGTKTLQNSSADTDQSDWDYLREVAALDSQYIGETILVRDRKVIDHSADHEAMMKKVWTVYKDNPPIVWVMPSHNQPKYYLY